MLKSYLIRRAGARSEFWRLWETFTGSNSPPENLRWDSSSALARVYPEGIRFGFVEQEGNCCYGPFAQGDTVKPSRYVSAQLLLGMRESQEVQNVYFDASISLTIDDRLVGQLMKLLYANPLDMRAFKWPIEDWNSFLMSEGTQDGEFNRLHSKCSQHVFKDYLGDHWFPSERNQRASDARRIYRGSFGALRTQENLLSTARWRQN